MKKWHFFTAQVILIFKYDHNASPTRFQYLVSGILESSDEDFPITLLYDKVVMLLANSEIEKPAAITSDTPLNVHLLNQTKIQNGLNDERLAKCTLVEKIRSY